MSNFININIKAEDEDAITTALLDAGFIQDRESCTLYHPAASLQLLPPGMITRATGEIQTVDGIELPAREIAHGYHANVRTTDPEIAASLAPLAVVAETPQYVWA